MPIYKYKCPECGAEVERIQNYDGDAPICPEGVPEEECEGDRNGVELERQIGRPNAHFRGSGFHSTDYGDSENPASK